MTLLLSAPTSAAPNHCGPNPLRGGPPPPPFFLFFFRAGRQDAEGLAEGDLAAAT